MPSRGRFYNVDPTPDNFRALWDRIHALDAAFTTAQATLLRQQTTLDQQAAAITKAAKVAQQAMIAAGSLTASAGIPAPGGGVPPVDTLPIPNHLTEMTAIWTAAQPTVPTLEWGWARTRELAWQFRAEIVDGVPFAMGLLLTGSGENLYTCSGETYKVGRVVYPNGHVFKILTDVPTTMAPQWADDGFVDIARYHVATDPGTPC